MKAEDKNLASLESVLKEAGLVLIYTIGLGAILTHLYFSKSQVGRTILRDKRSIQFIWPMIFGSLLLAFSILFPKFSVFSLCLKLVGIWLISASVTALFYKHIKLKGFVERITSNLVLDIRRAEFINIVEKIRDPENVPIGISLMNGKLKSISRKKMGMHSLCIGATGSGKTSLMKTRLVHAIKHNEACIIIDPKGSYKDIDELNEFMDAIGYDRNKFNIFSLVNPETSQSFNPIKYGTPIQKKDCILSGLSLTHEFYGAQASMFLSVLMPALDAINYPITISTISRALCEPDFVDRIIADVTKMNDENLAERLLRNLGYLRGLKSADLSGLRAQLIDLDNLEFGYLLSPSTCPEKKELDLYKVLKNKEIAYFQLSVNGYESSVASIGKLVIQNLKSLSSQIQTGQIDGIERASLHIDEFGAFAQDNFDKFLKICRDSNIGVHMYTQGLADLAKINEQFEDQVFGNNMTSFIFRLNISEEIEKLVSSAGTVDAVEQSYQVEKLGISYFKTGAGNMRNTKQMLIEHDVVKNLSVGQAIVIERGPLVSDLVQVWNPKSHDLKELNPDPPPEAPPPQTS